MRLTGNTVLIVGGTSGIGLGLAERLLARGNGVIVAGRRRELLDQIATDHPGMGTLVADVADAASILELRDTVARDHPEVNILVSMAGIMLVEDLLDPASLAVAEDTVVTNLLGTIRLTSAFLPLLLEREAPVIVTVSSGLAFVPLPMTPTYCATKAAIHSYTESLRVQLAGTPVQVIELVPPGVRTTLLGQLESGQGMPLEEFLDEVLEIIEADPEVHEVCVQGVDYLRTAERRGDYDDALAALSQAGG
jgi:short-subunit dehydrogenase involved in D-alanine esterification of teichoic acids